MHTLLHVTTRKENPVNVSFMIKKPFIQLCEQGAASFTDLSVWYEVCLAKESALGHPFPFHSCSEAEGRNG